MTVIGIGVDVVDIARFEKSLARTPSLSERLFVESERGLPLPSLAARFAAKRAASDSIRGSARSASVKIRSARAGVRARARSSRSTWTTSMPTPTITRTVWPSYSTVTDLARLRGWSTSSPRSRAISADSTCSGTIVSIGVSSDLVSGMRMT